jgi:hypothetical protein
MMPVLLPGVADSEREYRQGERWHTCTLYMYEYIDV